MPVSPPPTKQQEAALRKKLDKIIHANVSNRKIELDGIKQAKDRGPLLKNDDLSPLPEGLMLLYKSNSPDQKDSIRYEIALNGFTRFIKKELGGKIIEERSGRLSTPEVKRFNDAMKDCGLCSLRSTQMYPPEAGQISVQVRLASVCNVSMWSNEWYGPGKSCLDVLLALQDKGL